MKTTKHTTGPTTVSKTGRFVRLRALLDGNGIGARKTGDGFARVDGGSSMSVRGLVLAVFCVVVGVLALDGASAQATVTHKYLSQITGVPAGAAKCVAGAFGTGGKTVATDAKGDVYVAETGLGYEAPAEQAVDEFNSKGECVAQIGKGVLSSYIESVAVNDKTGELYVASRFETGGEGHTRVDVFSGSGVFLGVWEGKSTPSGNFPSSGTTVAVDNSASVDDPDSGDVYVSYQLNTMHGIDVFNPKGTGKEEYVGELTGGNTGAPGGSITGYLDSVSVDDASGDVLAAGTALSGVGGDIEVEVFAPTKLGGYEYVRSLTAVEGSALKGIGVVGSEGSSGDIYVPTEVAGMKGVYQFSEAGVYLGAVTDIQDSEGYELIPSAVAVAGNERVYFAVGGYGPHTEGTVKGVVDVYGGNLVIPNVAVGSVSGLGAHGVTLNGTVDTDSGGSAECRFEYGTSTSYGQSVPCDPATVPSGSSEVAVSAVLGGLSAGTVYHYRLEATNVDGLPGRSGDGTFTTLGPVLSGESVTDVTASSAMLRAQVGANGAATRYYFEYGTSTAYGSMSPALPGMEVSAAEGVQSVSVPVQGLQPGVVYHYRLLATSVVAGGETVTLEQPDHTFTTQPPATTQPASEEQSLPDGRQYELVSPVEKDGAEILGIVGSEDATRARGAPGGSAATQAAENGASVTYLASSPIGSDPAANTHSSQILSTRGPDGWSSQDIENPQPNIGHFQFDKGEEYRVFSVDLSRAAVQSSGTVDEPSLAPELHQEVYPGAEIYLRDDESGSFRALLTEQLPQSTSHVYPAESREARFGETELVGATPDLEHLVFSSFLALSTTPPTSKGIVGSDNLYEWYEGQTQLVNVLPNMKVTAGAFGGGVGEEETLSPYEPRLEPSPLVDRHAISSDGTRVVWGDGVDLYSRDMASEETVQLDESEDGGTSGGGVFQGASSDGTRVFFTDKNKLTSGAGEGDLYMFDITAEKEKLKDLTPGGADGGKIYVLGANEAGTSAYVVAQGVLPNALNAAGASPTLGASNVYVLREGTSGVWGAKFVAALTPSDAGAYFKEGIGGAGHGALTINMAARVSPNGRYLAFMSNGSPTGYDNADAISGEPDEEVYLYDVETSKLVCASCDPTGARPVGEYDNGESNNEGLPMDPTSTWRGHRLAALIPGGNENLPAWAALNTVSSFYESRVLSNEGRLFFDSADALVPQDVNGVEDVYEYEPPESITEAPVNDSCAIGSQTYSAGSEGCVSLISSGRKGGEDSLFVDASANGDDVFFTTADGLVKEGQDGSTDLYDAHVCTSVEPCYPAVVSVSPPCTTTESCRAAPTPQPALFGAPASATFSGSGNVVPASTLATSVKKKVKTAAQVRAEKLKQALKACRRKAKEKRKGCEVQARKRYGKAKSSRASKSSGQGSK